MTVASGRPDSMVTLQTVDEPSGAYIITLDQPEMLAQDDEGGLHVLINVSDVEMDETQEIVRVRREMETQFGTTRPAAVAE